MRAPLGGGPSVLSLLAVAAFLTIAGCGGVHGSHDAPGSDADAGAPGDADRPAPDDAALPCEVAAAECGATGASCEASTDCPAQQVCTPRGCECAFPHRYELALAWAPSSDVGCWDGAEPDCGLPDLYAVLTLGGEEQRTPVTEDATASDWRETFEVCLEEHTTYGLQVWDSDPGEPEDDLVFELPALFWFLDDDVRSTGLHVCSQAVPTGLCIDVALSPL